MEQLGREVVLNMVVLYGPIKKKIREKQKKNNIANKKETSKPTKQNSPVDVIHGIKEDGGAISWFHDNTVNKDMLIFVQRVMLVNVPPPSRQPMVSLPHEEHFADKVSKVGFILEHGI